MKKRYIGIALGIVAVIIIAAAVINRQAICDCYDNYVIGANPRRAVENSIKLELPKSAEVVAYDYSKAFKYYNVKLKIDKEDISEIQQGLLSFFQKEMNVKKSFEDGYISQDVDVNEIQNYYQGSLSSDKPINDLYYHVGTSAMIMNEDNQYYLYISSTLGAYKYEFSEIYQ